MQGSTRFCFAIQHLNTVCGSIYLCYLFIIYLIMHAENTEEHIKSVLTKWLQIFVEKRIKFWFTNCQSNYLLSY